MSRATCNGERYDIDGSIKSCFMLRRLTAALCLLYATKAFVDALQARDWLLEAIGICGGLSGLFILKVLDPGT